MYSSNYLIITFFEQIPGGISTYFSLIEETLRRGKYNDHTKIISASRGEEHEVGKAERKTLDQRKERRGSSTSPNTTLKVNYLSLESPNTKKLPCQIRTKHP
jgi:hypothetical protein